jgi:hypothetical protein
VAITLILLLGTLIFHLERAVEPKQDTQSPPVTEPQASAEGRSLLPLWEAFWFSLNLFLPVQIPAGSDWKASSSQIIWRIQTPWGRWDIRLFIKFITFATLLKVAGWILVPVGVAGLAGILKR